MASDARSHAPGTVRPAAERRRKRTPPPPPVLGPLLEGGHRDRQQQPAAQAVQRLAGNAATATLFTARSAQASVQRDDDTGTVTDSGGQGAGYGATVDDAANPRAPIEAALASPGNRDLIGMIGNFAPATDDERLQFITTMSVGSLRDEHERAIVWQLWSSFGLPRLPEIGSAHLDLWQACNAAGANLPTSWLGAAAGSSETTATEQVGASEYVVEGAYRYMISADTIFVDVPMNFEPDDGVAAPTGVWFGYIQSTWNTFAAINSDNPTDRRNIEFRPMTGSGHTIQVSAGNGRANAGHYYLGDTRAPQTIPHEFGHLIGLEDEYERDAADYTRVTGEAAPAGDANQAMTATMVAMLINDGLMSEEHLLEWHSTAVMRRRTKVEQALAAAGIVANYQSGESTFTHEVAEKYIQLYGHDLSVDIAAQVDRDKDQDWREKVAGTFQYTNTGIMGDMSDHEHPVAARHVRKFAEHVAAFRGGTWTAQPR